MNYIDLTSNMMKIAYGNKITKDACIAYLKDVPTTLNRSISTVAAHFENIIRQEKFLSSPAELKSVITMLTFGSTQDFIPSDEEINIISENMNSDDYSVEEFAVNNLYIMRDHVFGEYSIPVYELITFLYAYHKKHIVLYCGIDDSSEIITIFAKINRSSDKKVSEAILDTQRAVVSNSADTANKAKSYNEPVLTQDDIKIPKAVMSSEASGFINNMFM